MKNRACMKPRRWLMPFSLGSKWNSHPSASCAPVSHVVVPKLLFGVVRHWARIALGCDRMTSLKVTSSMKGASSAPLVSVRFRLYQTSYPWVPSGTPGMFRALSTYAGLVASDFARSHSGSVNPTACGSTLSPLALVPSQPGSNPSPLLSSPPFMAQPSVSRRWFSHSSVPVGRSSPGCHPGWITG